MGTATTFADFRIIRPRRRVPPPPYSSCHPVPYKCPVCDGGQLLDDEGKLSDPRGCDDPRPCPCCKGTCVVWGPPSAP